MKVAAHPAVQTAHLKMKVVAQPMMKEAAHPIM